jgi:hypothetical protein
MLDMPNELTALLLQRITIAAAESMQAIKRRSTI